MPRTFRCNDSSEGKGGDEKRINETKFMATAVKNK